MPPAHLKTSSVSPVVGSQVKACLGDLQNACADPRLRQQLIPIWSKLGGTCQEYQLSLGDSRYHPAPFGQLYKSTFGLGLWQIVLGVSCVLLVPLHCLDTVCRPTVHLLV